MCSQSVIVTNDSIRRDVPIPGDEWGVMGIFKFDGKFTRANTTKDPSIFVKTCRKSLLYNNLNLQTPVMGFGLSLNKVKVTSPPHFSTSSKIFSWMHGFQEIHARKSLPDKDLILQTGKSVLMRKTMPASLTPDVCCNRIGAADWGTPGGLLSKDNIIRMEEVDCPLCGSDGGRVLFHAKDYLLGHPGSFREVKCARCGLVYINPRPVAEDIGKFYSGDYDPHVKKPKSPRRRTGILKKLMEAWYAGSDLRTRLKKDAYAGQKGKVLDVGCGAGAFLARLKALGWEVHGVETDPTASKAARGHGLEVKTGRLGEVRYPDSHFDIVTTIHVLEHIHEPLAFMEEIRRILKPGGKLYVEVPNTASFNFHRFGREWFHLDAPRHICSYSPYSLRYLLSKAGFKVKHLSHLSGSVGLRGSIGYARRAKGLQALGWIERKRIRRLLGLFTFGLDLLRAGDVIRVDAAKAGRS